MGGGALLRGAQRWKPELVVLVVLVVLGQRGGELPVQLAAGQG